VKITIATGIYPPEIGGPATYLRELVPVLKKKGWKVDVITYGAPRKGIVTVPRDNPLRSWAFMRATMKSARDSDLIFATDTFSSGLPAAVASWRLKKRFIIRFVGDNVWENARSMGWTEDPFEIFQKREYNWKIEFLRKIQRWVLRRAEIYTVSNFLKSVLLKWGMKRSRITVIYNAVAQMKLSSRDSLRKKLKFDKKFVLLNVGRITKYKGVDKIIRMCEKLRKDIPELLLVVVGDGPAMEEAQKAADKAMISHIVRFVGRKDAKKTRSHMRAADVLVLNSEYEGMSHVLLEAMSVNCPVVASAVCGNPELVTNRGLLFEYNDMNDLRKQVLKLYNKPKLAQKYAKKAFKELPTREQLETKVMEVLSKN